MTILGVSGVFGFGCQHPNLPTIILTPETLVSLTPMKGKFETCNSHHQTRQLKHARLLSLSKNFINRLNKIEQVKRF